jgi:ParB-like chromosome segregation protein Spo0J
MSETFALPNWRELKIHPIAERVRRTSETEFARLVESLEQHGFQAEGAITLDSEDMIVDGRCRFEGCLNLDARGIPIEPLFRRWDGKGSLEEYVHSRNVARRHLTPEEQEAQIRQKLTQDPERSDRQIAREVGASPTTVGKKRREMEDAGQLSSVDSSVGADRRRRARKARSARPNQKPPEAPEPAAPAPVPTEALDFSDQTDNCLEEASIQTVADLGQTSEAELVGIRNFDEQSRAEVRENLAGLGQRLAGPSLEMPTEEEHEAEPPWTPAPAAPEPWLCVPVAGEEGSALWVPDWPEEGTDAERSEWAGGLVARLHAEAGLAALDEIARQCLAELLTEGRAETVRSVVKGAANALQGCEDRRDHAAPGPAAPRGRLEVDGHR